MIQEIEKGLKLEMQLGENMSKAQESDVSMKEEIKNFCSEVDKKSFENRENLQIRKRAHE